MLFKKIQIEDESNPVEGLNDVREEETVLGAVLEEPEVSVNVDEYEADNRT